MIGDRDTQMVLLIVLGAALLWWIIGKESCEGCMRECSLLGGDKSACHAKCSAKGLDCPLDLKTMCDECVSQCTKGGTESEAGCIQACKLAGPCKSIKVAPPKVPVIPPHAPAHAPAPARAASPDLDEQSAYAAYNAVSDFSPSTGVVFDG